MFCYKILYYFKYAHRKGALSRIVNSCKYSSQRSDCFVGTKDRFNGITVDTSHEICKEDILQNKLENSLNKWINEEKRCIWFKVNIKDAFYVPILAQKGFNFHHARDDFVMMYKWLPRNSEPNLPPSCHTNLGVGAMVFNSKNQILAVSERYYDYPLWKLPGGYVERGEDLVDAAVREVKEETGVNSAFLSLITFRHTHKMMFENSDIYVLLMMKALTEKIIRAQREVVDCKWMDIEEYTNHPHVHEFNRLVVERALKYKNNNIKLDMQKRTVKYPSFVREITFLSVDDYNKDK